MNPHEITPTSVAAVRRRIDQMTGEIPSSDGTGTKSGTSDRTGSLAFRQHIDPEDDRRGHLADVALAAANNIDRLMRIIITRSRNNQPVTRQVAQLDHALTAWEPLNDWSVQNLQGATVGAGEHGCVDCARVPDSLGRPLFNPRHTTNVRCRACLTHRSRVRTRPGHENDETCPRVVILWRERNPYRDLRDAVLDELLDGKRQP